MTQRGEGPDGWIGVALVMLLVEILVALALLWLISRMCT